jgi:hypothetical protein
MSDTINSGQRAYCSLATHPVQAVCLLTATLEWSFNSSIQRRGTCIGFHVTSCFTFITDCSCDSRSSIVFSAKATGIVRNAGDFMMTFSYVIYFTSQ